MEFVILNVEEYEMFANKHPNISIYQLSNWGTLKEKNGWKKHLVGLKNNNKIVAATLLLEKKTPVRKSLFYAPRGFLIDATNESLLKEFTKKIIDYIKKNKGFLLKIDPNVIYNIRNNNNEVIKSFGEDAFNNYKKVGFKHFGYNLNFETLQPRFLCRFKLEDTYENTLKTFQKSTRKHLEKINQMGIKTEPIETNQLEEFMKILNIAGDKNDFIVRPLWYYETMKNLFPNNVFYYLTYIDVPAYINYLENNIKNIENELNSLEEKFTKYNIGDKMKNEKAALEKNLSTNKNLLDETKIKFKNKKRINIGALMSVFIGNEGITFMSGTDQNYREFYPKFAYYDQHIKDSLKRNKEYVNFYGISGDLKENSKYYGIYEIKKGFNPEIVELLGEFDYIINKFDYRLYKLALKGYKIAKKIKK